MKEGMHMAGIAGVLLLALLVMMAGLYMLAHAKKENLNKFYSTSALVAVIFSVCVFVFGIAGGIMCAACGKCNHERGGKMKHRMMMMHHGMRGHDMIMNNPGGCPMGECGDECGPHERMKMRHHGMRPHGEKEMMKKEIVIEIDKDDEKNADTRIKKDETIK